MTMALLASSPQVAMDREHPYEHRYFAWLKAWSALADLTEWDFDLWNAPMLAQMAVDADGQGLVGPPPWPSRPLWAAEGPGDELGPHLLLAAWREFSARAVARTRRDLGAADTRVRYHAEKTASVARLRERSPLPVRAVVLHRDPRDVWLSIQAFDEQRGYYGFGRALGEDDETWFERALAMLAERSRAAVAERERPDSLVLAYEDLVGRPDATAARLGEWLELDLDPAAPARDLERHGDHSTSASPEASVGRWRRELEPERRERFSAALGPELRELGYDD